MNAANAPAIITESDQERGLCNNMVTATQDELRIYCPRCGKRLLYDYDEAYCLSCGTNPRPAVIKAPPLKPVKKPQPEPQETNLTRLIFHPVKDKTVKTNRSSPARDNPKIKKNKPTPAPVEHSTPSKNATKPLKLFRKTWTP